MKLKLEITTNLQNIKITYRFPYSTTEINIVINMFMGLSINSERYYNFSGFCALAQGKNLLFLLYFYSFFRCFSQSLWKRLAQALDIHTVSVLQRAEDIQSRTAGQAFVLNQKMASTTTTAATNYGLPAARLLTTCIFNLFFFSLLAAVNIYEQ